MTFHHFVALLFLAVFCVFTEYNFITGQQLALIVSNYSDQCRMVTITIYMPYPILKAIEVDCQFLVHVFTITNMYTVSIHVLSKRLMGLVFFWSVYN